MVNKFLCKNTKKLPKLKKIILNFGGKTTDVKHIAIYLTALTLITNQKGILTTTKQPNMLLKIKKGNPVGCKITLRKKKLLNFYSQMLIEVFPKLKNFDGFKLTKKNNINFFSYKLNDIFIFNKLKNHYHLFNNLPILTITIVTTAKTKNELVFILKSFKFPFKKI